MKMQQQPPKPTPLRIIAAWFVHFITAATAAVGLYTLWAIEKQHYVLAFSLIGIAVFIDAIDGTLARLLHVKTLLPQIDGALLDNMADFINYVLTPGYFLLHYPGMLPETWKHIAICSVILASCYQFTQSDAKTADNFFKGFPSYWNFVVFYFFIFATPAMLNFWVLILFVILVFVPIKYVYPSRMDNLTRHAVLRKAMLICSILYGLACIDLLAAYPERPLISVIYSIGFLGLYFGFSIYRTLRPLPSNSI